MKIFNAQILQAFCIRYSNKLEVMIFRGSAYLAFFSRRRGQDWGMKVIGGDQKPTEVETSEFLT